MATNTPFIPKQALKFDGALLKELQGDVSDSIARSLVEDLGPFPKGCIIHDNVSPTQLSSPFSF